MSADGACENTQTARQRVWQAAPSRLRACTGACLKKRYRLNTMSEIAEQSEASND
jgi:hypothetical protein